MPAADWERVLGMLDEVRAAVAEVLDTQTPATDLEISDEELAKIKTNLARQEAWALEHGYARKCPNCGDVVWEGGERCGCGRTKPPVIITDADLAR